MTTQNDRQDQAPEAEDGGTDGSADSPAQSAAPDTGAPQRKSFVDFLRSIYLLRRKRSEARQQHNEMPSHFAQLEPVVEPKRGDKPEDDEPIRSAN